MTEKASAQQVMRQMFADVYPEAADAALDALTGVVTAAAKPEMTAADSARLQGVLELLGLAQPESATTPPPEPAVVPEPAVTPAVAGLPTIDLAWLLMIAEQNTPGDPVVSDWGALMAAVSRVHAEIFGIPVYDTPPQRAAALLQQLINVPALERGNALFAAAAAYGYLAACGLKITTSPEEVRDLVRRAAEGADIYAIASTLKSWIL